MDNRQALVETLDQTQQRMVDLVTQLTDDQLDVPYHVGVNPPVWEAGHAAFFYETFIFNLLDGEPSQNPDLDNVWDSFYLPHAERWSPGLFPNRADTLAYLDTIYRRVRQRIREYPLDAWPHYLYRYAICHQNMHIESMSWCRQTVGYPAPPHFDAAPAPSADRPPDNPDITIPGGTYRIGLPTDDPAYATQRFSFDNEKPGFDRNLDAFGISKYPVSNGEFLAFVEAGGYERPELWSFGGRRWLETPQDINLGTDEPAHHAPPRQPAYWRRFGGAWYERQFESWRPLDPAAPVRHISFWEAEAYCQWAGRRLPTEFEWEAAALGNRPDKPLWRFPWGDAMDTTRVAMDGRAAGLLPVDALPEGDSPFGCRQMVGTVWEWTSNDFLPYDGFAVDIYPFMSTLQFGDHKTTRGGSYATASCLIRGTYRQAYLPGRQDVFTGFRTCAREADQ
jgi:iron(II)-dependent oxidoreductase